MYLVLLTQILYVRGHELQSSKDLHGELFRKTLHEKKVTVVFSKVASPHQDCCYVSELAAILGEVLASAEAGLRGASVVPRKHYGAYFARISSVSAGKAVSSGSSLGLLMK